MLVQLLSDIVSREYEQWLRYTYLSSLGFGLHTDALSEHFRDHGSDELEHAAIISRWIVDMGDVPPTELMPVEQFCGSAEEAIKWLLEFEHSGIELYQCAYDLAAGNPALQDDIASIMSTESDHISDLLRMLSDNQSDPTIIIVADKEAQTPPIQPYSDVNALLREGLENASYKYGNEYNPQLGYESLLADLEESVKIVWEFYRDQPDARESLLIYKNVYEWLKNPSVVKGWSALHDQIWPEASEWLLSDKSKEEYERPSVEDIWKQMQPEGYDIVTKYKQQQESAPAPIPESEEVIELEDVVEDEEPRRPAEEYPLKELEYIEAADPRSKRKFKVGVGDRIRNKTLTNILKQERKPGPSWPVTKMSLGTITKVNPDHVTVMTDMGEEEKWYPRNEELEIDVKERQKYLGRQ